MLAIPDGFRIASAYVDVSLNQDELLRQIGEVKAELSDLSGTVKFDIDQASLARTIEMAKEAFASQAGAMPIKFDISQASLTRAIEMAKEAFASEDGVIPVTFNVSQASMLEAVEKAKAFFGANPATMPVKFDVEATGALSAGVLDMMLRELRDAAADLTAQTTYLDEALTALGIIQRDTADSSADLMMQTELLRVGFDGLDTRLDVVIAHLGVLNSALLSTRATMGAVSGAASSGARGWTIWGQNAATAIHWIISGSAELLAVLIPATVAAGAWAFVWVQGATNVYQHMRALFTATESLGQAAGHTMGEVLGLNGAWQAAQNAANVNVYQAWGSALLVVKEQFGDLAQTGTEVGKVFDSFAARLVYDFSSAGGAGKTMGAILQNMVPDLTRVGEVFGSLGHFIASVASQMPGLAEILLRVLAGFIGAASAIAQFAGKFEVAGFSILTAVMAVEEFMRWGGLLVTILGKLGFSVQDVGDKFLSWQRFSGVFLSLFQQIPLLVAGAISKFGEFVMTIGRINGPLNTAGQSMMDFGENMKTGIKDLSFWQAGLITVAAVGLAILIDKLATARTATQEWADSLVDAVQKASNATAINTAANALTQLNVKLQESQGAVKQYSDGWKGISNAPTEQLSKISESIQSVSSHASVPGHQFLEWVDPLHDVAAAWDAVAGRESVAMANSGALIAAQKQVRGVITNVAQGAVYLANTYHLTLPEAMALATTAGVSLTSNITGQGQAADIARAKVASLAEGYQAMGVPMGQVGTDMEAMAIDAGEQGSQVEKLNQAWSDFMSNLTGGTSDLGAFTQAMGNLTNITNNTKFTLSESTKGMSLSAAQFAKALTGSGQTSAQAWQNFDQVVGSTAPTLIEWLNTARTVGAATGGQVTQAIRDIVAQMLPFAKDSNTAAAELGGLVQMAGGPAISTYQQLAKWTGHVADASKNLSGIIDSVTIKMGNMSQIAANLGNVLNQQLSAMMDAAKIKASNLQGTLDDVASAMQHNTLQTTAGQSAWQQAITDLEKIGYTAQQAKTWMEAFTGGIHTNAGTVSASEGIRQKMIDDLSKLGSNAHTADSLLEAYTRSVLLNGSGADSTKGQRAHLIKDLEQTGLTAKQATTLVNNLTTAVTHIPPSGAWELLMTGKGTYTIAQAAQAYTHPSGYQGTGPPVPNAKGGMIGGPGGPTDDKVPAWLSAGEYVVRAASVDKYGKELFDALNTGHYADGGLVEQGTSVLTGQYIATMQGAMKTTVQNALVGAMLAALHSSEKAAASSGGGGYAGPGGGSASANEALARSLFPFGSSQWQDFVNIAMRESGFSNTAMNPSGAYGIAQALPSSKYPLAGRPPSEGGSSNPTAQITWMFDYIRSVYGTPANAWSHEQSAGWYDRGGLLMPGVTTAVNTTGRPETVLPNSGGINITFNGSQWPGPEQIQAFTLALTSAIAHA